MASLAAQRSVNRGRKLLLVNMDVVAVRIRKAGLTVASQTIQAARCGRTLCPTCLGECQNRYRRYRAPLPGFHNSHLSCQVLLVAVTNGHRPRLSWAGLPQPCIALTGSTWPQMSTITQSDFVPQVPSHTYPRAADKRFFQKRRILNIAARRRDLRHIG